MPSNTSDSRFKKLSTDPRFIRFKSMLTPGSEFTLETRVDKRGRQVSTQNMLSRFYKHEDEHVDVSDVARGVAVLSSDDEEEELIEQASDEEIVEDIPTGDETNRLAIVNLDWDYINATDIFKLCDSFAQQGCIKSEFGKERMKQEAISGPPVEIFPKDSTDQEFNQTALRKYQLDRMKYFYAILEADSVKTARSIYQECNGMEFESSANILDLRYVPVDMGFEEEDVVQHADGDAKAYKPKEFITTALQHTQVALTWDADDTDRVKVTKRKFKKEELAEMDFKAYIASDGSDDEEVVEKYRDLVQGETQPEEEIGNVEITFTPALEKKVKEVVDMKRSGISESVFEKEQRERKEKRKARRKAKGSEREEVGFDDDFFQTLGKETKKKKREKSKNNVVDPKETAELELLMTGDLDSQTNIKHFDAKDVIKAEKNRKGKKGKKPQEFAEAQQDFEIDVNDSRFASALTSSHEFFIDPTNPKYKKTANMERLRGAISKVKRGTVEELDNSKSSRGDLDVLVQSVKRKSQSALNPERKKSKK